jgi:hypothetical protein
MMKIDNPVVMVVIEWRVELALAPFHPRSILNILFPQPHVTVALAAVAHNRMDPAQDPLPTSSTASPTAAGPTATWKVRHYVRMLNITKKAGGLQCNKSRYTVHAIRPFETVERESAGRGGVQDYGDERIR